MLLPPGPAPPHPPARILLPPASPTLSPSLNWPLGLAFSVSFPPADRVWLKVTAVIPYPAARLPLLPLPPYRLLGFCFTPFYFWAYCVR